MKIVNVKVIKSNRAVYCKILTDEGITGLGESGAWGFLDASAQAIETFSQYLIGKDPMDIEHLWQSMYRYSWRSNHGCFERDRYCIMGYQGKILQCAYMAVAWWKM